MEAVVGKGMKNESRCRCGQLQKDLAALSLGRRFNSTMTMRSRVCHNSNISLFKISDESIQLHHYSASKASHSPTS